MSFFCNFQSDKCPGQINGNPLNGLCEKVCLQVKKVFDACMQQSQLTDIVLNITNLTPANPTYPLTFISAKSTVSQGVVSNLLIEPLPERPNCARVKSDILIPISVAYTDANNVEGVATAESVLKRAEDLKIEMPICRVVEEIIYHEKPIKEALLDLLNRPLKTEQEF